MMGQDDSTMPKAAPQQMHMSHQVRFELRESTVRDTTSLDPSLVEGEASGACDWASEFDCAKWRMAK